MRSFHESTKKDKPKIGLRKTNLLVLGLNMAQLYIYTVKKVFKQKQMNPIFPSLIGGLEHFFIPIVGMMIRSDFHIFQRG